MADRVPSDHDAVETHRTAVERVGRTPWPRIPLPEAVEAAAGDVVRVSLEGETCHAQVQVPLGGGRDIRGAFANARLARTEGEGENRLHAWLDTVGLSAGEPVLLDAVTPGHEYGLRRPGHRVVYAATDPPPTGLADIARDLDG